MWPAKTGGKPADLRSLRFPKLVPRDPPTGGSITTPPTEAFYEIVDSGRLHASHVRFFADASEVAYGGRLFHNALVEHASHWDPDRLEDLEELVLRFSQTESSDQTPVYAFALSREVDDIAQWERYADDGRGVCIGFDPSPLWRNMVRVDGGSYPGPVLRKVVYDRDRQEDQMAEIIETATDLVEEFGWGEGREEQRSRLALLAHEMAWPVLNRLFTFKQSSYKSEDEWRLVYTMGPHVHKKNLESSFRPSERGLVPYIELEPEEPEEEGVLPIREVVTGPRQPSIEAPMATRNFLESYGYTTYPRESASHLKKNLGDRFSSEPVSVGPSQLSLR